MKNKDPQINLWFIFETIEKVETFLKGVEKEEYENDLKLQDALVRNIEVIGEAVKNLPQDFREKNNHIEWAEPAKMRDVLAHDYFEISLNVVWLTATKSLPDLKKQIKPLLNE